MVDAILSAAAERILVLIEDQARYHVNLVRGVEEEVLKLSHELKTIKYVVDDAENRRFKDKMINYWLSRLESASFEMEDVLDEWNYAILKLKMGHDRSDDAVVAPPKQKLVCSFIPSSSSCLCFKKVAVRHDIAKKIVNVKAKLDEILKEKDRYNFVMSQPTADPSPKSWRDSSTSFTNLAEIHGRDFDRDIVVTKLMGNGGRVKEELGIQVVSIVGVGGLGKTTLAQLVYNDSRVEKSFDLRIWVCVSDPFDLVAIAKGILESVKKEDSPSTNNLETLLQRVRDSISGKKFLLVLDDIWTEEYGKWERLENYLDCGGAGSKILVTTRKEKVAKTIGTMDNDIHRPRVLSDEHCWLLLRRVALLGRAEVEFEDTGKEIAKKCDGLPLAAKTLGSLLRSKNTLEEWKSVLNSEIWEMKEAEVELFPHLLLSYNELSPTLKRCFSYCAVFPKDSKIYVEDLIGNWMALGYLGSDIGNVEGRGREYFDILAMHSLFQDFEKDDLDEKIKSCKMHDIVHDFAQFLRKSSGVEAAGVKKTTCRACDPLLVSTVNEFCSLFWEAKKSPPKLCDCLKCLRVLSLSRFFLQSIPQGMENLIHLRWLSLDQNSLSREDLKIIFQLYNLQTLWLRRCDLKEIPREIGNLIHLRDLHLSINESLKELPREIGNLIHLRHLDLSMNESLKELPREIGNLIHLKHLHLSKNESLKELPREIGNLIHLRYLDLSENVSLKELPREIGNLIQLRYLDLRKNVSLKELPGEIENLIQLRHLDLRKNVSLKELPGEIGNLIQLRHLDLSMNESLKELPREIGNLIHLRNLNLSMNWSLKALPETICGLHELRTLDVFECNNLCVIPEGLAQLTGLRELNQFHGGSGRSKLGLLKNLNHLSGSLKLRIRLADDDLEEVVKDVQEAELRNKIQIEEVQIIFEDEMDENEKSSSVRMDVIDALEPHPNLRHLLIRNYKGSKLPLGWIISPLNQVTLIILSECNHLSSLPPLGKLPCLEEIHIHEMEELRYVGREFLGLSTTIGGGDMDIQSSSNTNIAFPKLKKLIFLGCLNWKEWKDITAEEEESAAMSLMPCLTYLETRHCHGLTTLPHRLLRKAPLLEKLKIYGSPQLRRRYRDKDGSDWKSISQRHPRLQLEL